MSSKMPKKRRSARAAADPAPRSTLFSDPNLITCLLNHGVANSAQHVLMHTLRPVSRVMRNEIDGIVDRSTRIADDVRRDVAANAEHEPDWQLNRKPSGKNPSCLPDWMYDFYRNAASMTPANMKTFLETPTLHEAVDMAHYTSVRIHIKRMNLLQTLYMDAPACTILLDLFSEVARVPAELEAMKAVLDRYFPRKLDELYGCIFTAVHVHAGNKPLMWAAWKLLQGLHDDAVATVYRMPEHCQLACDMLRLFCDDIRVMVDVIRLFLVEEDTENFFDAVVGDTRDAFSQSLSEVMQHYLGLYQGMSPQMRADDEDVQQILLGVCTVIAQLWRRLDGAYYECDGFDSTVQVLAACMLSVDSDELSMTTMDALRALLQNIPRMAQETRELVFDRLAAHCLVDRTLSYWNTRSGMELDKFGLCIFGQVISLGFRFSNCSANMRMVAIERAALLARDAVHTDEFDECHTIAADVLFALAFEKDPDWQRESRKAMVDLEIISFATMVISLAGPRTEKPILNVATIHAASTWVSIVHALVVGNAQNEAKVVQFGAIEAVSNLISCTHTVTTTTDLDREAVIFLSAIVQAQYALILQRDARRVTASKPVPRAYFFSSIIQSVARAIQRPVGITMRSTQCSVDLLHFLYEKDRLSTDDAEAIFHAIAYILKHECNAWGPDFSSPILRRILDIMLLAMDEGRACNVLLYEFDFVFPRTIDVPNRAAVARVKAYLQN